MPELAYAGQTSADTSVSAPSNCRDIVLKGDLAEYFNDENQLQILGGPKF